MADLRWAVMGTGRFALSVLPKINQAPGNVVVALASRDLTRAVAVAKFMRLPKSAACTYDDALNRLDIDAVYIDAESMLEIKSESKRKRGDQELELESSLGDYKEVGGLMLPFSIEQKPKGAPQGSTITIEKIELDVAIDDAIFAMPVKKAEVKPAGN